MVKIVCRERDSKKQYGILDEKNKVMFYWTKWNWSKKEDDYDYNATMFLENGGDKATLRFYKDIDKRMDYLHDFVEKNYNKDKDKFHKISGRYSHEFNRNHGILKNLIKELEQKIKNKTMKQASDCLQEDAALHTSANCAFYLFAYENMLREFGFLVERLIV